MAGGLSRDRSERRRSAASRLAQQAAGNGESKKKPVGDAERYESSHIGHGRKRLTVDLDVELHERLQNAVYYAQHHGEPGRTKVGTIHRAVELVLQELREHFDLEEFPSRGDGSLRQGAPLGGH